MGPVLLVSRFILAATFLIAAVAKIADCAHTHKSVIAFGISRKFASLLAGALPIIESSIAIALLSASYAWQGGIGALMLLVLFTVAIAINLARGRAPICRCFGRASSSPVGVAALLRTEMLIAVAALVVWQGRTYAGPSVSAWMHTLPLWRRAILLVIVGASVLAAEWVPSVHRLVSSAQQPVKRLMNRNSRTYVIHRSVEGFFPSGLPVGATAPPFDFEPSIGGRMSLRILLSEGLPVLLLFSSPSCAPCRALAPTTARWRGKYPKEFAIGIVSVEFSGENGGGRQNTVECVPATTQCSAGRVAEAYRVPAVPSAVIVLPNSRIGSRLAVGFEAIDALVRTFAERSASRVGARALSPSPQLNSGFPADLPSQREQELRSDA